MVALVVAALAVIAIPMASGRLPRSAAGHLGPVGDRRARAAGRCNADGLLLYAAVGSSLWLPRNLRPSLPFLAMVVAVAVAQLARLVPRLAAATALAAMVAVLALNAVDTVGDDSLRRSAFP